MRLTLSGGGDEMVTLGRGPGYKLCVGEKIFGGACRDEGVDDFLGVASGGGMYRGYPGLLQSCCIKSS